MRKSIRLLERYVRRSISCICNLIMFAINGCNVFSELVFIPSITKCVDFHFGFPARMVNIVIPVEDEWR